MQVEKKIEEKQLLIHFKNCFDDFPEGKIIDTESPDFIIKTAKKEEIGIELTRLFLTDDGNLATDNYSETFKHELVEMTKEYYFQMNNKKISVLIELNKKKKLTKENINKLANEIAQIINKRTLNFQKVRHFRAVIKEKDLPKWIKKITIVYNENDKIPKWRNCYKKAMQDRVVENIQSIIDKKQEKLKLYHNFNTKSQWLVITSNSLFCSIGFNIKNLMMKTAFESNFDKIILFDYFKEIFFELDIKQ